MSCTDAEAVRIARELVGRDGGSRRTLRVELGAVEQKIRRGEGDRECWHKVAEVLRRRLSVYSGKDADGNPLHPPGA